MLILKALRRVSLKQWAWVHFKFALGILWPLLTLASLPSSVDHSINRAVVYIWFGLTIIGAVFSIVGIVMSAQPGRCGVLGIPIELTGLVFMFAGPFLLFVFYLIVYIGSGGTEVRPTVIGLTYALSAALVARFAIVIPQYMREAHDETKEES